MPSYARRAESGTGSNRGPEMYMGYCQKSRQYRMMDLPDFMDNMQAGMTQMTDPAAMQRMWSGAAPAGSTWTKRGDCGCGCGGHGKHHHGKHHHRDDDCGCGDKHDCSCHCECCVCDADILVHARCGELRRIPITFENDTRRDKPVALTLEKFVTAGGRDLGWTARLSETQFTLHPCDEHTVSLLVAIKCKTDPQTPNNPDGNPNTPTTGIRDVPTVNATTGASRDEIFGDVDRCEVGYATIRAEGCLTRPIVVAVAVLPDDCDAYRNGCGCGCCSD